MGSVAGGLSQWRCSNGTTYDPTPANIGKTHMHLTNFAINKHHDAFTIDEGGDGGHKRSITSLLSYLKQAGYATDRLWGQIKQLIVKTLLAVQPHLAHVYHSLLGDDNVGFTCFEVGSRPQPQPNPSPTLTSDLHGSGCARLRHGARP